MEAGENPARHDGSHVVLEQRAEQRQQAAQRLGDERGAAFADEGFGEARRVHGREGIAPQRDARGVHVGAGAQEGEDAAQVAEARAEESAAEHHLRGGERGGFAAHLARAFGAARAGAADLGEADRDASGEQFGEGCFSVAEKFRGAVLRERDDERGALESGRERGWQKKEQRHGDARFHVEHGTPDAGGGEFLQRIEGRGCGRGCGWRGWGDVAGQLCPLGLPGRGTRGRAARAPDVAGQLWPLGLQGQGTRGRAARAPDVAEQFGPLGLQKGALRGRRERGEFGAQGGDAGRAEFGVDFVRRPGPQLCAQLGREAEEVRGGQGLRVFGGADAEPFFERGVDALAVGDADVVAMRGFRRTPAQASVAVGEGQIFGRAVPGEDLLQTPPHGVALAVPTELVPVDEPARREAGDDDPRQKTVAAAAHEIARGFP